MHERYRQTTDGRTTIYSEHEHEFTFAKKLQLTSGFECIRLHLVQAQVQAVLSIYRV